MNKHRQSTKEDLPSLRIPHSHFKARLARLVSEMEECVRNNERINLSVPPHVETTVALYTMAYSDGAPDRLRIEYNDGSLGKPFPIRRLWQPPKGWGPWQPKTDQHLHIGTLSLRHVDYDRYVDVYLLRDKETRHLNQGDIDALAYSEMGRLLKSPQLHGEFYLTILQAGLESLAVGVYRALVEHLEYRNEHKLGPMRVASIFRLDSGRIPPPLTIWGTGGISA